MKPRVVILGGGAQARVVLDVFEQAAEYEIAGIVAQSPPEGGDLYRHPYLGPDAVLPGLLQQGVTHAFVAIGGNRQRLKLCTELRAMGFELANAISPRAYISPHAKMGAGIVACHGVVVNVGAEIGDAVILNTRCSVDHDSLVERGAHICAGVTVAARVSVGEGVNVWPGAVVTNDLRIGEWSTVGAGALVMRSVDPGSLIVGLPARRLKAFEGDK
jgi:UDP-perosamine 4-acetyltransferase